MRTRRAVASVLVAAAAAALLVRSPALAEGATLVPSKPLLGFDAAATQTSDVMARIKAAGYQAVGVYLPVSDREQDNRHVKAKTLPSGWVSEQLAAGWSILPIYLGLQAPNQCQPVSRQHKFWAMSPDPAQSYAQGAATADDAIKALSDAGMPADAPVYYDLEAYNAGCTAVEAFLGAWSAELASHGHPAGVYGSLGSTMTDLGDRFGATPACALPSAVWPATGNGKKRVTGIGQLPATAWADHQRVNQFELDATFDYKDAEGKTAKLTIDKNWVDAPVVGPTGTGATPPVMPVIGGACISAPPGGVQATRGDRAATIAWAAPSSDGGSQVTGYRVDDLVTGSESQVDVGTTRLRLTGLANGTTHRYTVTAVNGVGDSVASATVSVTPAGRPRQVAKPTVVGKRRAVTVRWRAPGSNGSALTRFKVKVGARTVAVGPRQRRLTVKGLRPGSYQVTVVAVNGVGAGTASPAARVKVRR